MQPEKPGSTYEVSQECRRLGRGGRGRPDAGHRRDGVRVEPLLGARRPGEVHAKGEILKVWDLKAGRTGPPRPRPRPLREEPDLSAKNPTTDWCEAEGKSKTCDMKFKGWKDKA